MKNDERGTMSSDHGLPIHRSELIVQRYAPHPSALALTFQERGGLFEHPATLLFGVPDRRHGGRKGQ